MRSLTIISHTEHYILPDGSLVGLGSTVTEINELLAIFDNITHVAMLHHTVAPPSALPYVSDKIRFVALPAVGGETLSAKMAVVVKAPKILGTIRKALRASDYFQFRAPTGMGVFVIPYLLMFNSQKGWFKYAGNWKPSDAPLTYRFQKWLLERQSRPVTINGFWEDQPKHCLSYENPCLTEEEIQTGQMVIASRKFQFPLELCFVGRLETAKGVDMIIESLAGLGAQSLRKIRAVHLVGAGGQMAAYQKRVDGLSLPIIFHGFLSRIEVHEIYKKSHAILLPSASEGFPKVIAEAMNYGCIPMVSNISSISHYVNHKENGFLMEDLKSYYLKKCLMSLLDMDEYAYKKMVSTSLNFINTFSYTYYNQRLLKDIL
ncbi:glycosyltransferase [Gelidibacter maritimus]|uniref:Glycosyltransferase family 4 protein n=1 Tax=Gelidibacter maritimus TaxID=2761487 RepID=A0A7W2M575_9FLAO|nr:glycosyltransferase [Gelidibacter maritimus]MBA6152676.1 glycosyltransferase family 4 protein [Gelidibacter maritimus]